MANSWDCGWAMLLMPLLACCIGGGALAAVYNG